MSGLFRSLALQQTTARLLLTLALLPTGPVMGMGVVAPEDLGLRVTEAAPKLGQHIRLAKRTSSLEWTRQLARQAAQGAWLGISAKVDGLELPTTSFGKGKKLREAGVRLALEALHRSSSFTSKLFSFDSTTPVVATGGANAAPRAAGATGAGQAPLTDLPEGEIPPPPTPPDASPSSLPAGAPPAGAASPVAPRAARSGAGAGSVQPMVAVPVVPAFNLLSISWQPNDPSPGAVFLPIASAVRRVFAFDACDTADPWKVWDAASPGTSDLTAITPAKGFWLEGQGSAALPEGGPEPTTTSIPLCLGWNLIGYPAGSARPVATALASIAGKYIRLFGFDPTDSADPWEVYDVGVPSWANDLTELRPGRGYWIYVTEATTLTISNEEELPDVAILSPADLAEVTGPTAIVGTVRSPELQSWTLSFRAVGDPDWIVLGTGTTPLEAQTLGTLDPTLLENGLYEVRLRAIDTALNFVEQTISLSIEGQRKIGHFSLAFVDLEVPLSGIPIQVIRGYDSRRGHRKGDFGQGWELEVKAGSYRTNRPTGDGWNIAQGFLPCDTAQERKSHISTVKLSDREVYRFRPVLTQLAPGVGGCYGIAGFAYVDGPVPGATLQAMAGTNIFWATGSSQLLSTEGGLYDPPQVRLTTRDGRAFEVNRATGVTKIADPNGNAATFTAGGISHTGGSSITFERDGQNRITRIVDPEGADLVYAYDAAGDLTSFTDRTDAETTYTYEGNHYLREIHDPLGRTPIRNEYGPDGRLTKHVDAFGHEILYDHQLAANREIVTNRLGASRQLDYDARGNVTHEVDESGVETTRTFDGNDQLLTETDELGNTTTYVYDANRNLTSTTDPLGNVTRFTYDAKGNALTTTDPRGGVTTNLYDAKSNLTRTTDAAGAVTNFTYNTKGELLTELDALGNLSSYQYDSRGRMTRETNALGQVTTSTYNSNGDRLTETRTRTLGDGTTATEITRFTYDSANRPITTTAPDGSVTRTEYDALGNVEATVDALGRRTEFTYDELGRQTRTDHPDGTFDLTGYDAENRRISSTDRASRETTYEYDPAGRLRKTFLPDDGTPIVLEQVYDEVGRLHQSIDARGNATTFGYDDSGRRTTITDALNQITFAAYDPDGNQVALTDPRGNTTAFVYDAGNRLTRTVAPDATFRTTGYDALGRRISETDESGKVTQFGYDALGRLATVTDALNQVTTYAYDEAGNRISQTDANGHVTRFEFDSVGRQTKRILPDGASERFTYDAVGNRSSRTDFLGRTTLYDYDLQSRLLRRTYPGNVQVSFTYTPTGRRLTATDDRGVTTYGYDTRDRVTSLTYPDGRSLEYAYDEVGNRTALTANVAGRTLTTSYTYDDLNRLDTVTDPIGGVYDHNYDANGNRESLLFPNGVATTYAYNAKNQLLNISTVNNAGTTLVSFAYTLAPTGNRTKIVEHDGVTRNYAYDNLYRLTDEHVKQGTAPDAPTAWRNQFAYDPVGNRLEQLRQTENATPQPVVYTYDERDRLLTENGISGPVTYGWDANGNQTAKSGADGATYVWDIENRLVRVELVGGTVVEHEYDVDGVRIQTRTEESPSPMELFDYVVDTSRPISQIVVAMSADGAIAGYHVRGDDLLCTLRPMSTPPGPTGSSWSQSYLHAEGIGTIRAVSEASGDSTDSYSFEAFGALVADEGVDPNMYLFDGEHLERETGWYNNRARWMQPEVGRFASVDPVAGQQSDPQSLHKYGFVGQDPIGSIDPSGLSESNLAAFSVTQSIQAQIQVATRLVNFRYFIYGMTAASAIATALSIAPALSSRVGRWNDGYWNDDLESLTENGSLTAATALLVAHFMKWRQSEDFRRPGKHEAWLGLPSPPGVSEGSDQTKVFGPTLRLPGAALKTYTGGRNGRVFDFQYRIGPNAKQGRGFFRFRLDYWDYRGLPRFNPHCHLIYGQPGYSQDEHRSCRTGEID
jgi:RHS repeat-associated protein